VSGISSKQDFNPDASESLTKRPGQSGFPLFSNIRTLALAAMRQGIPPLGLPPFALEARMRIDTVLSERDVVFDTSKEKYSALAKIAVRLAKRTGIDDKTIRRALLAREHVGSTGFGKGVAVPHALLESLAHPIASLTRLAQPIDYGAIDGKPVDLLFTMLWPSRDMRSFLPTLAHVCRMFRSRTLQELLRHATTPAAAFATLCFQTEQPGPPASTPATASSLP
jgi:nitrogen PTS system EIIA component